MNSVAAQLARKPAGSSAVSRISAPLGTLQRKCACGGSGGGECAACRKKKQSLQRSAPPPEGPEIAPSIVHDVLRSSGQPLDVATRAYMEPRFGHDFGKVRLHTDAKAAESAQSVNAHAYTVGNRIAFASGRYSPDSARGMRLLAHELAHVVQQSGSSGRSDVARSADGAESRPLTFSSDSAAERAACSAADAVMNASIGSAGVKVGGAFAGLARDTAGAAPVPTPAPVPSATPPLCPKIPAATPASCTSRHDGYCAAQTCFPSNSWLSCVCGVSALICEAGNAFTFVGKQGTELAACAWAFRAPAGPINDKGNWFLTVNRCIWGHWRAAVEAINDSSLPMPTGLTPEWASAVTICRSKGVGSSDCCKAHVVAEQNAIDHCSPYNSSIFLKLPTDVPGAPRTCSRIVAAMAPGIAFTGDFGSVSDRIAYGNKVCRC